MKLEDGRGYKILIHGLQNRGYKIGDDGWYLGKTLVLEHKAVRDLLERYGNSVETATLLLNEYHPIDVVDRLGYASEDKEIT